MNILARHYRALGLLAVLSIGCATSSTSGLSNVDRTRVYNMLRQAQNDVKEHYYDVHLRGVDWDAEIAKAEQKIDAATSLNMAMSHVAAALDAFNDSHTFFVAPPRPYRHDYGFRFQMIGDRCYVTHVRPQSDAEARGLKAGDELLGINGFRVGRDSLWKVEYVFNLLRPQLGLRLDLKDQTGSERQLDVLAQTRQIVGGGPSGIEDVWDEIRDLENHLDRTRTIGVDIGNGIMVLKVRLFNFQIEGLERFMEKASRSRAMILDLRGNGGGGLEQLKALVGLLFDEEVKIGDRIDRKKTEPITVEPNRGARFAGKLVVLVDSFSASSSEVVARVVQLRKRGIVLGDRTSGSVMEAIRISHVAGVGRVVPFGVSVSQADLVMTDGNRLENAGVLPDEVMTPTADDLAQGLDPVLARAVAILGGRMSPAAAGKLFPYEWPPL